MDQTAQDYINKLSKVDISEEDKKFWTEKLSNASAEAWKTFFGFLETYPSELGWLRSIYVRKQTALQNDDRALWEAIIKEEEGWIIARAQSE